MWSWYLSRISVLESPLIGSHTDWRYCLSFTKGSKETCFSLNSSLVRGLWVSAQTGSFFNYLSCTGTESGPFSPFVISFKEESCWREAGGIFIELSRGALDSSSIFSYSLSYWLKPVNSSKAIWRISNAFWVFFLCALSTSDSSDGLSVSMRYWCFLWVLDFEKDPLFPFELEISSWVLAIFCSY